MGLTGNITTTHVDTGNVILDNATHRDKILTVAGAGTIKMGTLLATLLVASAVVAVAGANTGNGTVTAATVVDGQVIPIAGAYNLRVTAAVANGGVFQLRDPNGAVVASNLTMTAGAGAATVMEAAGLQFTVTDGTTDFIVGDSFTLTVASGGNKLVPYAAAGAGGAQIATDVLTYDVVTDAAGDVAIRSMVSGRVRLERLIVAQPDTKATSTHPAIEQLRQRGIIAVEVTELGYLDNTAPAV